MLLIVVCYHLLSAARPTPVNNKPIAAGTATDIKTNAVPVRMAILKTLIKNNPK